MEQIPTIKNSGIDRLMTYEEYENAEQIFPHFFEVEKNGRHISYFGADHIYDPHHEQIAEIKDAWKSFASKIEKGQSVVLVEGGTRDNTDNEEEAIRNDGEAGLATYLAEQAGIPIESPEPSLSYEVAELLKQFSKEEILYYYFSRSVDQWKKVDNGGDALQYAQRLVSDEAKALRVTQDIFITLSETHKKIFGTELDLNDLEHFEKASDPANIYSVSNQVARATSILRDQYILKEIEKKWNEGKSLFIVYGATHAIMQEPAIRYLVNQEK